MFVVHFVKSIVCVYVFVVLTFLNQLFKHWSQWENGKPVVSQVCRQPCCSVFYFYIQTLFLQDLILFCFSRFPLFKCSNLLLCFVLIMFGGTCRNHHCFGNSQTECTSCCMLLIIGLRLISLTFCFFCQKRSMSSHKCEKTFNDINDMVNKVLYIHFSHCLVCPLSAVLLFLNPWWRRN